MYVLGFDPGVSGAISVLTDSGGLVECFDMPVFKIKGKSRVDVHSLGLIVGRWADNGRAVIELVGAMPGQGVTSMFTFGFATGAVHGVVGALRMPLQTVPSTVWKRHFHLGREKEESRQAATRRWSSGPFSRVKDGGKAEAALIALYSIQTTRAPAEMAF